MVAGGLALGATGCVYESPSTLVLKTMPGLFVEVTAGDPGDTGADVEVTAGTTRCGLRHDLASPHLWEGDLVDFQVWCEDPGASPADVQLEVLHPGHGGAELRPGDRVFWQTNGRDGGRHDLVLSATVVGQAGLPETLVVPVWVADSPSAPEAVPPDPATYEEEWGLPVVHIDHRSPLTQEDQPARFTVRGTAVDGEVKIRGATSVAYPKNSFTLDFDSDELEVEEWGERSRGHMVLTSTFDDNSYLRQKLSFDLWAALAQSAGQRRLAPRTFFAVVYRNGVYEGLYMASDRIDDELARHMDFGGDGDLYKAVSHSANYMLVDDDREAKADLAEGWEKKEGADETDLDGIRALTSWAAALSPDDFPSQAGDWIQRGSFRDWQLFTMVAFTEDSAGKNHYIYQDDETGQYSAVPWDFNASWGQSWKTTRRSAEQLRDHAEDNRIFWLQERSPEDCGALVARFDVLRSEGGPFDPAWLLGQIADYEAKIGPSALRDEQRWGAEYRGFERWAAERDDDDDWTDFTGELSYLRAWIPERLSWVDQWVDARCGD